MSVKIMTLVFETSLPDVEIATEKNTHTVKASTAKFVLLALADCANDQGQGAYPSLDTLAKKTDMTRRTVQRALDALLKMGIVLCVGKSEYGTDNYSILSDVIYGGSFRSRGVTLVPDEDDSGTPGDDSGAENDVPESPEPSFNPSINQSALSKTEIPAEIQEAIDQGNKRMDKFLEVARNAQEKTDSGAYWPGREKIPEPIRELLDVYVELTAQRPTKGQLLDWLKSGNDWLDQGAIAQDIRDAYKKSKPDKGEGFIVSRPGSLTTVIGAIAGERRLKGDGKNTFENFIAQAKANATVIEEGVEL